MRLLSIVIAATLLALYIFDVTEIDAGTLYASTPFDRCMEAFQGTSNANQCYFLK